jgi:hypothetical protein
VKRSLNVAKVDAPEFPERVIRHIALRKRNWDGLDAYWRVDDILNQCSNSETWTPHLTARWCLSPQVATLTIMPVMDREGEVSISTVLTRRHVGSRIFLTPLVSIYLN